MDATSRATRRRYARTRLVVEDGKPAISVTFFRNTGEREDMEIILSLPEAKALRQDLECQIA